MTEGVEAIAGWATRALQTSRMRYECYTGDYGNEIETLIGQGYSRELIESEVRRFVEECLLINPYILEVTDVEVQFETDKLTVYCTVDTVYGEVQIYV